MTTESGEALSAAPTKAGLDSLTQSLPAPTDAEVRLTRRVLKVDLSLNSGSKWSEVAHYMSEYLGDLVSVKPVAGGGGMASTQSSNQWTNRIKQDGVANRNTTVFTIGQRELLPEAVRYLTKAIGQPTTRVENAVIVCSEGSSARVVRLIVTAPGDGPTATRLIELAPAVPVDVVAATGDALPNVARASVASVSNTPAESEGADAGTADGLGLRGRGWCVARGTASDRYANVDGGSHHFLRASPATQDQVSDGDWLLMFRPTGPERDSGKIYGVGRIHKVHKRDDDRYAMIAGVDTGLLEAWSSRRQAIEHRQRDLAATFVAEHHRAPTAIESLALAQRANLETRPAKHEPRSEGEQRGLWRRQASAVYAGDEARDDARVSQMVAAVLGTREGRTRDAGREVRPEVVAHRVLETLESSRATWQVWHVRAEALRQARVVEVPIAELDEFLRNVERRVLADLSVPVGVPPDLGEPDVLRRPDGQSAYVVHGSATYTSTTILAAEEDLLELAARRDGRQVDAERVEAVIAEAAKGGLSLDRSQAGMVRSLATSGSRVQVALAPAGSGKTTALAVLARAWEASGGEVVGLAPTAVAADELGRATGVRSETLAKSLHEFSRGTSTGTDSRGRDDAGRGVGTVGPRTLVLIDEAAMAGTRELAAAVEHVLKGGGSVRLVGDDQQLGAVGAGGVFRDLAEQGRAHGTTTTLTELHRFVDQVEAAATLAVRDGDPAALDYYLDNGRVHSGDVGTSTEAAYAAWTADQQDGKTSLLLAATRDIVLELNERARQDRLDRLGGSSGTAVGLADGTRASAGDVVVTRQNDRTLRLRDGSWVKNGDRWRVLDVRPDGGLALERLGRKSRATAARVALPVAYAAQYLHLGYASTIHGAQGATVDTTHTVLTGTETRQSLYVAVSRGRESNHLYLGSPALTMDEMGLGLEDPSTGPREVLTAILERDGRPQSATTTERGDASRELREAVLRYQDALPVLAQHVLGEKRMAALDDAFERWLPGITAQPGYPGLRGHLALRWVDGEAPRALVDSATWFGGKEGIADSDDPAAVLAWRISDGGLEACGGGPLPWLPEVPSALRASAEANDFLERLTGRIEQLRERVVEVVNRAGVRESIPWRRALPPDVDCELVGDLAVWRASQGVPVTDQRPTGRPFDESALAKHQARLEGRLTTTGDAAIALELARPDQLLGDRLRNAERITYITGRSVDAAAPRR